MLQAIKSFLQRIGLLKKEKREEETQTYDEFPPKTPVIQETHEDKTHEEETEEVENTDEAKETPATAVGDIVE
jgi:hypothetical protein